MMIKNKNRILITISLVFYSFLIGCNSMNTSVKKEINFAIDSMECTAFINSIKTEEVDSTEYTFIYAKFIINNITDKNITILLKSFKLLINDNLVGTLYIDSIASVLVEPEIIKPHAVIEKSIYWAFEGSIDEKEISSVKIIIDDTHN